MWNRWTTVIRDLKVPYGYTLGNHDSEADLRRREIVSVDMKNPYSLTELAPEELEQASTFVLPVYSSKNPEEVVMNLWFFDSGDYNCMGLKGYGCVGLNTVQWYREKSKELRRSRVERSRVWRSCTSLRRSTCMCTMLDHYAAMTCSTIPRGETRPSSLDARRWTRA